MAHTYQAPPGFSEQDTIRLGKLNALIEQGRNPYEITTYDRTHTSGVIREQFDAMENQTVRVADRLYLHVAQVARVRTDGIRVRVRRDRRYPRVREDGEYPVRRLLRRVGHVGGDPPPREFADDFESEGRESPVRVVRPAYAGVSAPERGDETDARFKQSIEILYISVEDPRVFDRQDEVAVFRVAVRADRKARLRRRFSERLRDAEEEVEPVPVRQTVRAAERRELAVTPDA